MRSSFWSGLFLITLLIPQLCLAAAPLAASVPPGRISANNHISASYENATLTEDVTWRGIVVVQGALVVAPQATLRIDPGTEIRFSASKASLNPARLVVLGRLQCVGTPDRPVHFTSNPAAPSKRGEWGGLLLLSSEKRNQLEHCRIEGAETGVEARFSTISLKSVVISTATTGMILRDSIAGMTTSTVSGCDTGIEAHDSELEVRETTVAQNRRGAALYDSSVLLSSVKVAGNTLQGILAEECRIKLTSSEITGNGLGAEISGGEGQVFLCRFMRNTDTALHLASARLKVNHCQITDNLHDGLKLEDDSATIWDNAFSGNGGDNLVNAGSENITALQNWWGAMDESSVKKTLFDSTRDGRFGAVNVFPWLLEKPALLP